MLIREQWHATGDPDAQALLDQQPELREDKSFVLDLVSEEYHQRSARGEKIDLEEFSGRFPDLRLSIQRMLLGFLALEINAEVLEKSPKPVCWPMAGEKVGDLTLIRELGRGAFARVFLASEASTGNRPVAVKLSVDGAHEAKTLGPLSHPHIVPVWSARRDELTGMSVVCMPYRGEATLESVLNAVFATPEAAPTGRAGIILETARRGGAKEEQKPDPVLERGTYEDGVVRLLGQMTSALTFLHMRGICHRDLKPSNVLLSPSGQALLLDFNLSGDGQPSPGQLGGTLPYMAPEQLRVMQDKSQSASGPPADVFALGVIAFELLTGRHPFGPIPALGPLGDTIDLLLQRQMQGPRAIRKFNPQVGRSLASLLERCLDADPAKRPSAAELESTARRHFSAPNRCRRWLVRRPLATAAILAFFLALTAGGLWGSAVVQAHVAARERVEEATAAYANGRALMTQPRRLGKAFEAFQKSNTLSPDGRNLACMAYCKARLNHHTEAIEWSDEAIEFGFKSAGVYNNRGYSRMMVMLNTFTRPKSREQTANAFLEAARDFEEALRLDPNCHSARCNRITLTIRRAMHDPSWTIPEERLTELRAPLQGPHSARLAINAARLYGLAIGRGTIRKGLEAELLEGGLNHLQLALELGHDPQALPREPLLDPMKRDERFEKLLKLPRKGNLVTLELDLIDPIPPDSN
jgi:tetratricopeptide (TPR) repeat protein